VVEDELERLLLRLVGAEDLREELRAEVGERRADRDAGPDAAERQELDREAGRRPVRQAELLRPRRRLAGRVARLGHPADVALDVGQEDRHAGRAELLGQELHRPGLAGARRAGDEPVAVEHRDRRLHAAAEVEVGHGHGREPRRRGGL
jgi:hypothetical protein